MTQPSNTLLAKLPRKVLREISPHLEPVVLTVGQALQPVLEHTGAVHFPLECVLSVLVTLEDTRSLEVALVGNEGLVGYPLLAATGLAFPSTVQTGGAALRIGGGELRTALRRQPALQAVFHDYGVSLMAQIASNAGCNHFHVLESRLARRLLMTRERLKSDTFRVTQEFLSSLLAVRRVGISKAASSLQRQGIIEYHRGQITILDRRGLVAASCACARHW